MSFLSNLFGRSKKNLPENLSPSSAQEKPLSEQARGGTTLRKQEDASPQPQKKRGPELSALEMAERQSWEVKSLPVWKPGDEILGLYRVEDVLEGGMGRVYIAHHKGWNVKLAIKSPNEMMLSDRSNFARVLREADSWTELGLHPNIAYCYYVRSIEEVPHIFVEYVDGGNLRQWIEDGKCIDYRVSLDLAIQFCHGMEWAHSKGMIHRDIKPENVLMTKEGVLKITDFGLVRTGAAIGDGKGTGVGSGRSMTRLGDVMGTDGFMAPEQFEDPAGVDERADIFSFGVCLYEMFCGNRPYSITYGKPQDAPDPVTLSRHKDFHPALAELLTMCVQWERDSRFGSFEEIRQVLAAVYLDLYGQESAYAALDLVDLEADGLNNRGVSHLEMRLKERAIQCFQKALEINETHPEATYNLSLIEWREGIIDDLYVLSKLDCCKNNPANEESKIMELIGYVHLERSDIQSAMDSFAKGNKSNNNLFSKVKNFNMMCLRELVGGHSGPVTSVAVSNDSKYVLSASGDRTIFLWDIHSGRCIKALIGHMGVIYSVTFSPDGLFALSGSGGRLLSNQDHTLKLWDLQTGTCVKTMAGHTDDITSVAMCPYGKYAVSGSWDKTLKVWNLSTGEILHTLYGHEAMINAVAITPEGRYIISGGGDWKCRLWDIEGGNCIQTFGKHAGTVHAVAISPNGKYFVCGGSSNILEVWEITAGEQISTLKGHRNGVMSVAISPNGQCVLSGGHDKTIKFWDFETGKCLRTFEGHKDLVRSVAFSPDGKLGVSCGGVAASGHPGIKSNQDFGIRVWKLEPTVSKSKTVLCMPKSFERIRKEREKEQNALGQVEKLIDQTRYEEGFQRLILYWKDHQFSENSKILGLYEKFLAFGRRKNLLASFLVKDFMGYKSGVNVVAVSHDGVFGLSATFNTISIWNISSRIFIRTLELDKGSIKSLALSMDGTQAVLGRQDNMLDVWDLSKGECIRRLEGHKKWINSVAVSPDFKYAVSGSGDESFRIWDIDKGVCLKTIEETDSVWSVAITPDGKYALSGGSNKTIKIWDLASGKCLKVIEGGSDSVCALAISPDGRYAMSGHWDNPLKLWDLSTGSCLKTLPGHLFPTKSITFTPDGRYVVSGGTEEILKGYDSTIKIWEIATGECIANMTGHEKSVYSMAVSPDGRRILSGSGDNTVKEWRLIWDLEFPDIVDWDEGIRPYLEIFLTMNNGIWNEADYKRLFSELSLQRGYGWVRPEGIRNELEKMTKEFHQEGGYRMVNVSSNKYLASSFYFGFYLVQIAFLSHKGDTPQLLGLRAKLNANGANLMLENSQIEKILDFKSDDCWDNYTNGVYGRNTIYQTLSAKYNNVVSSAFGLGYDSLGTIMLLKFLYIPDEGAQQKKDQSEDKIILPMLDHLIKHAGIISENIGGVKIFKESVKKLENQKVLFYEGKYSLVDKNLGDISDKILREFEKISC